VTLFQPMKVFVPVALLLELLAVSVVYWQVSHHGRVPDATVAIIAMTGVVLFGTGLLADLISRRIMHLHDMLIHDRRHDN